MDQNLIISLGLEKSSNIFEIFFCQKPINSLPYDQNKHKFSFVRSERCFSCKNKDILDG